MGIEYRPFEGPYFINHIHIFDPLNIATFEMMCNKKYFLFSIDFANNIIVQEDNVLYDSVQSYVP